MYALFLETKAAEQCRAYAKRVGMDVVKTEELLNSCYECIGLGRIMPANQTPSEWLVARCLKDDSHKSLTINNMFIWDRTQQGWHFWDAVYRG